MTFPLIVLDFETYYDDAYSLRKMTTEAYIRDPRFEVVGVAVAVDGESAWLEVDAFREFAAGVDWSEVEVGAHHAHFDGLILSHHFGIRPRKWHCSLSLGRLHHGEGVGGSLARLSEFYGLPPKGDEVTKALGKRRRDFTLDEWRAYGAYSIRDALNCRSLLDILEAKTPAEEVDLVDLTVRMFTNPRIAVDLGLLESTIASERARKEAILSRLGLTRKGLGSNDRLAGILRTLGVEPPTKISPTTGKTIFAFAASDPGMDELIEHPDEAVRTLAEARLEIKSTIVETRAERLRGAGSRGPLPVYLKYSGALTTHRWSGGDKMNLQNLSRGSPLRAALLAPPGHVFIVADSSQIEARGVAWLADNGPLLNAFASDADIYSAFASSIYGQTITADTIIGGKKPRSVGKVSVLGLGYQMGGAKFASTLQAGPMGMDPIVFGRDDAEAMSVDVEAFPRAPHERTAFAGFVSRLDDEAKRVHLAVSFAIVRAYRERERPHVELWRACQELLELMADGGVADLGIFRVEGHRIHKPNGLALHYKALERAEDGFRYLGGAVGREWRHIYGGKLVENLVQSVSRDLVAWQMRQCYMRYGYAPAMMAHDEIVLCVSETDAERATDALLECMHAAPEWAAGFPVAAEGGFGRRYSEVKKAKWKNRKAA